MRFGRQSGHIDGAVRTDFKERKESRVEAASLKIAELMRRRDECLGIGGAAELESEQWQAAHGALLDHPGHAAVQSFFQQNSRHVGGNSEPDVDGPSVLQFLRDTARHDFSRTEIRNFETAQRPDELARNPRIVPGRSRLKHVRGFDQRVHEYARDMDFMRSEGAVLRNVPDLGNDRAAAVSRRKREFHRAEVRPFAFEAEVSPFIANRSTDDRDVRADRRKVKPFLSVERFPADDRLSASRIVHRAAFIIRIREGVHPDFSKDARPFRRALAQHVEYDS